MTPDEVTATDSSAPSPPSAPGLPGLAWPWAGRAMRERLAAAGFGEFQPLEPGNSPSARARNRRIELKLDQR